jgi:hypothetical protein
MAEEGTAEAAPAFGGGTDSPVTRVDEASVEEAAEATEGEIIAMMADANFFTFSKKAFSSERARPWEEPTFSQSNSTPCAYEKCNGPLGTSLLRKALHLKDGVISGVKGLGEILHVIVWHLRLLLGPQPDKNPRKNAVNQLEDFLDGYPVRF